MTIERFLAIAPMFAGNDPCRPALHEAFRFRDRMFVTDGRIALVNAEGVDGEETKDDMQKNIGGRLLDMAKDCEERISEGSYRPFSLARLGEAVGAVFANLEPEMLWMRAREPDPDDPDFDDGPDSIEYIHQAFTAVILANRVRSVITGHYASLLAGLERNYGPIEAFAHDTDETRMLYFRGKGWLGLLMPLRVDPSAHWSLDDFIGRAISDAIDGRLVHGRESDTRPDMEALRGRIQP